MRLAPLHDFRDLIPVGDLLEWHHLDRRARDDHAIVLLVADFGERAVELRQVLLRRVARRVRLRVDEVDLDLQRRIAEQAQELRLRDVLDRHEVQDEDLERTDILAVSAVGIHDEDILSLEDMSGRQIIRYLDWHENTSFHMPRTVKRKQIQYFLLYHIPQAVYKRAAPLAKRGLPD